MTPFTTIIKAELEWTGTGRFDRDVEVVVTCCIRTTPLRASNSKGLAEMKPIDFRNETFEQLKERLTDLRMQVLLAWFVHGPGTTRQVAAASGIDILTFRPRTTELFQMGALMLMENLMDEGGREGIYRAREMEEWATWHQNETTAVTSGQQQLMG